MILIPDEETTLPNIMVDLQLTCDEFELFSFLYELYGYSGEDNSRTYQMFVIEFTWPHEAKTPLLYGLTVGIVIGDSDRHAHTTTL